MFSILMRTNSNLPSQLNYRGCGGIQNCSSYYAVEFNSILQLVIALINFLNFQNEDNFILDYFIS